MTDRDDDLLRRIEALEVENRRLRARPRRWTVGLVVLGGLFLGTGAGCSGATSDPRVDALTKRVEAAEAVADRVAAIEALGLRDRLAGLEKQVAAEPAADALVQRLAAIEKQQAVPDPVAVATEKRVADLEAHRVGDRLGAMVEILRRHDDQLDAIEKRAAQPVEEIVARAFVVCDAAGKKRGRLSADVGLWIYDENGKARALVDKDGLWIYDENKKSRAAVSKDGVSFYDENEKVRARLNKDGLTVFDENVKLRAIVGRANHVNAETGTETKFPAAFVLYKDDGKILWMAPSR